MTYHLKTIVFASLFSAVASSAVWGEDIAAILATTPDNMQISLSEDSIADNIVIAGRSVSISSEGTTGKLITNASGAPLFSVMDGGHLSLDLVSLQSQDKALNDTLVYVENATLTLTNCIAMTQRRFAVYMRGGELNVADCEFLDSDTAIAVTEGAQGNFLNAQFNNAISGALWVSGAGSYASLVDSEIAYGARGIAVDDGAQLYAEGTGIYSTTEVGILADAAGVRLKDVLFEGVENFGVYAQKQSNIVVEGGSILGPIDTGMLINNSNADVSGLEIFDAITGININGGATPVMLQDLSFNTTREAAVHILAEGHAVEIQHSVFEGGATGVGVISGSLKFSSSQISGQSSASIQINGGQGVGRVTLSNVDLVPEIDGVAIYANSPFHLEQSQIVYQDAALAGEGLGEAQISNTLFFGPQEGAILLNDGPRSITFVNDIAASDAHYEIWQAVVSAADAESRSQALRAVQLAFPRRSEQGELAKLSLFDAEMGETLQPAGWVGLGSLLRLSGENEPVWLGDLQVRDLPLRLTPSRYALENINSTVVIDLTGSGSEHWLELPEVPGPYAVYRGENRPLKGPAFNLRPQSELIQVMNSRWPGYAKYDPPAVPKPTVTSQVRTKALSEAKADVTAAFAFMNSMAKGATYDDATRSQRDEITAYRYHKSPLALRIFATNGSADDAAWLLNNAQPHLGLAGEFWAREVVKTAVEIEARLDILGTGAAAQRLVQFGADYDHPAFPSIAVAMASFGHAEALEALVDALVVERISEGWYGSDAFEAFGLVMHVNTPEVTEFALEFVDAFQAQVLLGMTQGVEPKPRNLGLHVYSVFYPAYLHAAAYAHGQDRQRLNVGIPQWNQMSQLGPVIENPSALFEHIIGMNGPELRALRNSELAFAVCDLIAGRQDGNQRYRDFENLLGQYGGRYPDDIPYPQFWAENIASSGATHCVDLPASLGNLENPQNREADWFSYAWNFAFNHPAQALSDLASASDDTLPSIEYIDSAPKFIRDPALESAPQTTGMSRYKSYASVATIAHTSQVGPFASGADTRVFLQPVEPVFEGYDLYWIGGTVKLAPLDVGDQTLFGLSINAKGAAFGGLASVIARHPDILALNLDNHAGAMIQSMALRYGDGQEMQMEYLRTLESGVHVYALPQTPSDQSNLVVDTYFATKGTDGQTLRDWVISWPLHRSPYGFNKMRETGRVTVEGREQ